MENLDEVLCSNDQSRILVKGKRTKRPRAPSPSGGGVVGDHNSSSSSPTISSIHDVVYDSTDQEDEDMANCLILLAQGDGVARKVEKVDSEVKVERCGEIGSSKRFMETVRTNEGKAGFYVYECKTCNRSFPSFQALGGHRASHKKPKMMNLCEDKKIQDLVVPIKEYDVLNNILHPSASHPSVSLHMVSKSSVQLLQSATNKGNKTHECSTCGAEFSSGQALGGHMRRHRAVAAAAAHTGATGQISMSGSTTTTSSGLPEGAEEKPRNILALDLNLPAPPEDDQRDMKFQFVTPKTSLVLSSPALVNCHY